MNQQKTTDEKAIELPNFISENRNTNIVTKNKNYSKNPPSIRDLKKRKAFSGLMFSTKVLNREFVKDDARDLSR